MMYRMLEDKTANMLLIIGERWIHVKDVCRAIRYLAHANVNGPVSVGTGNSVS